MLRPPKRNIVQKGQTKKKQENKPKINKAFASCTGTGRTPRGSRSPPNLNLDEKVCPTFFLPPKRAQRAGHPRRHRRRPTTQRTMTGRGDGGTVINWEGGRPSESLLPRRSLSVPSVPRERELSLPRPARKQREQELKIQNSAATQDRHQRARLEGHAWHALLLRPLQPQGHDVFSGTRSIYNVRRP